MQRSVEPRSLIARSLIASRIVRFPFSCWRMVPLYTHWGTTRAEGQGKARVSEGYLVKNVLGASGISGRTRAERPRPSTFTYHMHCRSTLLFLSVWVTVIVATSGCACLPRYHSKPLENRHRIHRATLRTHPRPPPSNKISKSWKLKRYPTSIINT